MNCSCPHSWSEAWLKICIVISTLVDAMISSCVTKFKPHPGVVALVSMSLEWRSGIWQLRLLRSLNVGAKGFANTYDFVVIVKLPRTTHTQSLDHAYDEWTWLFPSSISKLMKRKSPTMERDTWSPLLVWWLANTNVDSHGIPSISQIHILFHVQIYGVSFFSIMIWGTFMHKVEFSTHTTLENHASHRR